MFSQSNRIMLISTALLAIATSPAIAGKVVVKKGGANPTIQDGVNAASAGDKVEIRSGTYQENVTIPAGKDGLTLYAKGTIILDALPSGGVGVGPGITIQSANVTLEGFTVQNAYDDDAAMLQNGYGIWMEASGLTMKKMRVSGCNQLAVKDNGNSDLRVINCTISYNYEGAIFSSGTGFRAIKSKIHNNYAGFYCGDNAVVRKCTFSNNGGQAVSSSGSDILIEDNVVRDSFQGFSLDVPGGSGFTIEGNTLTNVRRGIAVSNADGTTQGRIVGNKLTGGLDYGIDVSNCTNVLAKNNQVSMYDVAGISIEGSNITVHKNTVTHIRNDGGILIDGDNVTITDNVVRGISAGSYGIYVEGVATGGVVSGNTVTKVNNNGIYIESTTTNLLIEDNQVRWYGFNYESGIAVAGSNHSVLNNTCRDGYGDGFFFRSTGSGHTISGNRSERNSVDGFDIEATNCLAEGNVSEDNGAEGIEVNGDNNIINNNRSKRNRIDMANDGAGNSFSGNNYDTGGDATPPEID